jgi:hypothetical protein
MKARKAGLKQAVAAAQAGFSERTGRSLERQGVLPSRHPQKRWKTHEDAFEEIWDSEIVPRLQACPSLTGVVLLEELEERYPGRYPEKHLRTLQRRIRRWRALNGGEREIMFRQDHPPGLRGLSDFTSLKDVTITIQGEPFHHLLYHFRLAHSGWSFLKVIRGGESFTALAEGLQTALRRLGGSPCEHRTDSLSAAFKNLSADDTQDVTRRYAELCRHYQMTATRNNRGCAHENGSVEGPHGHLKRRLRQALELRGSCDFATVEEYQHFIDSVVERHNRRHKEAIDVERQFLQALPSYRACDFEETTACVTTSSTIVVQNVTYSVPSRLMGHRLRIHLYDDRLVCYLGNDQALTVTRMRAQGKTRKRCIDYRHLIHSLARKPQAFRYSVIRDDLLPTPVYKEIWRLLDERCAAHHACKLIVGLLKLAADYACEDTLGESVLHLLKSGQIPSLGDLERRYAPASQKSVPPLAVIQHALSTYNELLPSFSQETSHA